MPSKPFEEPIWNERARRTIRFHEGLSVCTLCEEQYFGVLEIGDPGEVILMCNDCLNYAGLVLWESHRNPKVK